jgi:hypothetical protein
VTWTLSRLALAGAVAAVLVSGCGREEEAASGPGPAAPAAPSATPYSTEVHGLGTRPRVRFSASVARRLDAGGVGIVDFDARASIEPGTLWLNKEQKLVEVRWSGWGSERATGTARVRSVVCDPNCARGRIEILDGKVMLSEVRLCGSRRYYSKAELETTDPSTGASGHPATYLRTPC